MNLVLHSATEKLVTAFLKNPSHALLITGDYGVGASSLAQMMASEMSRNIITILPEKDDAIDLEKGILSVALIRKLYEQTRTAIDSRVVIIDYAERMAVPAQNAFLKLLEEPSSQTSFILVSHEPQKLLPTIRSRVAQLDMLPVSRQQSEALLDGQAVTDATKRSQILYIAAGKPAEMTRLASDDDYLSKYAQLVRDARDLLQAPQYERLVLAHKYKDDRPGSLRLIEIAMNMLRQPTAISQPGTVAKLEKMLSTYDRIAANGNIRLQLAASVL